MTHPAGRANGHVHGANLGIRGDLYHAAGGFPGVPEHEDVALVERARRAGARVVASDVGCVLTSGRSTGRTRAGMPGTCGRTWCRASGSAQECRIGPGDVGPLVPSRHRTRPRHGPRRPGDVNLERARWRARIEAC
ncbi:hypothetical protein NKG05_07570 [Oerskovia sp. M15]